MRKWSRWQRLVLIGLLASLLYIPGLGSPALWEPDEGRYAEIAREMVLSGDCVTPRDDWVRYFEKPPLMYWAAAGAIEVLGENEFAVRLPAALFSIGEVVVTTAIAETIAGEGVGLLAAIALVFSPLVWGFARSLTLDPALSFFITAALGLFYKAATYPEFAGVAARRSLVAAAAMIAMGTLAKGPAALVICGGVVLIHLAVEQRLGDLKRIPWLGCVVVYVLVAAPWFVAVARRNPEFLDYFFVHEHLHRYLSNTEHGWGPWFLIAVAAGGSWPWLYFAPMGLAELWRGAPDRRAADPSAGRFLAIWFLFVLIFFSIPRSKLGSYILPAMPPLAILAGCGLSELRAKRDRARSLMGGFAIANVAVACVSAGALAAVANRLDRRLAIDGIAVAAGIATGAVGAYLISSRAMDWAIAAMTVGVFAAMLAGAKARLDAAPLVSYRRLALALGPYLKPGCALASYRHQVQSLPFYTHSRETMVDYLGELGNERASPDGAKSFLDGAGLPTFWSSSCMVLVIDARDYGHLAATLSPPLSLIACEGKKLALYNRPLSARMMAFDCVGADQEAQDPRVGLGLYRGHL